MLTGTKKAFYNDIWANSSRGHKFLNIYAPNKERQNTWNKSDGIVSKKTQISSILVKDFKISLLITDKTSRQKKNTKNVEDLKNTIKQTWPNWCL